MNLLTSYSRGYVPCELRNLYLHNLKLDAELLLDCGCSVDLILPSRQIEKLKLRKELGGISARGFSNHITTLPKYEDITITMIFENPINKNKIIKTAIVSVFERVALFRSDVQTQCNNDWFETEPENETVCTSPSPICETAPISPRITIQDSEEPNLPILKLSPLKYPLTNDDPYGILGYPAMAKLNIGVHFGNNYIFEMQRMIEHA